MLPLTVYAFGRLLRIRKPYPVVAAVFATAFLFMEKSGSGLYSIYGGNILSTLAGEFGYMLSFALVALFMGTMYPRHGEAPSQHALRAQLSASDDLGALAHRHDDGARVRVRGLLLPFLFRSREEGAPRPGQ